MVVYSARRNLGNGQAPPQSRTRVSQRLEICQHHHQLGNIPLNGQTWTLQSKLGHSRPSPSSAFFLSAERATTSPPLPHAQTRSTTASSCLTPSQRARLSRQPRSSSPLSRTRLIQLILTSSPLIHPRHPLAVGGIPSGPLSSSSQKSRSRGITRRSHP